jgi:hypothetical protein
LTDGVVGLHGPLLIVIVNTNKNKHNIKTIEKLFFILGGKR